MNGVLEFLLGILSGVVVGYFIQVIRYKHTLRVEKIKRLAPYLELAYPTIDRLAQDGVYALKVQERKDQKEIESILVKLIDGLDQYHIWYLQYQENGLKPELLSVNETLDAYLNGLFVYAQMNKRHGKIYIHQRLNNFCIYVMRCRTQLEKLLMG